VALRQIELPASGKCGSGGGPTGSAHQGQEETESTNSHITLLEDFRLCYRVEGRNEKKQEQAEAPVPH
jgi:hypothetical protein